MVFFHLGRHRTVFHAEVFAIAEAAKTLIVEKTLNEKLTILVDNQAAILAIQNNIVRSSTELMCIKNLNKFGESNRVTNTSTPSHAGICGNQKADILNKSGSALTCLGPEPFITIPHARARAAVTVPVLKHGRHSG